MASSSPASLLLTLKRQWLLVLVVVATAAVLAAGLAAFRDVTYTATSVIALDASALARTPGLPGGERILLALRAAEYYEAVASASGTDAETVEAGLNSFAEGEPMERIKITFVGTDEALAERIAKNAGQVALAEIADQSAIERTRQEEILAAGEAAIAAFESEGGDMTAWETADAAYKFYALKSAVSVAKYALASIDATYELDETTGVTQTSLARSAATSGMGGAVAGLFLGIVLAYLKERSERAA